MLGDFTVRKVTHISQKHLVLRDLENRARMVKLCSGSIKHKKENGKVAVFSVTIVIDPNEEDEMNIGLGIALAVVLALFACCVVAPLLMECPCAKKAIGRP